MKLENSKIGLANIFTRVSSSNVNNGEKPTLAKFPYGLAVRIPGFHPGGPGSTPGMGK